MEKNQYKKSTFNSYSLNLKILRKYKPSLETRINTGIAAQLTKDTIFGTMVLVTYVTIS